MSACETGACNQDMSCRHHKGAFTASRIPSPLGSMRQTTDVCVCGVCVCVCNGNSFAVISLLIAAFPSVSEIISSWRKKKTKQRHSPNYKVFSVSPKSSSKVRSPYLSKAKQRNEPDKTTIYACAAPKHKSHIIDIIL